MTKSLHLHSTLKGICGKEQLKRWVFNRLPKQSTVLE